MKDPAADVVVEIHIPLRRAWRGSGYPWIDDVEEFLLDLEDRGVVDAEGGDGEEIGDVYVFWVREAPEETLPAVASSVAKLRRVPRGAHAVVTDDEVEDVGVGRQVDLPVPGAVLFAPRTRDWWLDGGASGADSVAEFTSEVDRVLRMLADDVEWQRWWRRVSKAPQLDLLLTVTPLPVEPDMTEFFPEAVKRGRKRHELTMLVDSGPLKALEAHEQRLQALPAVLEALRRVVEKLKVKEPHPAPPEAAQPTPLPTAAQRHRRLQELLVRQLRELGQG